MSGPRRKTLAAIVATLACLTGPHEIARATERTAADSTSSGPPAALRTEWTFDREALDAVGIRRPTRLAYDSDGNLHVLDAETRRITKLDPRGRVLYEVGGYGSDETSLELPQDIVVDRDQSLLVLDRGRGAVVAFDRAGRFLGLKPFQAAALEESRGAGTRLVLDRFGKLWLLSARARDLMPLDDRLAPARTARYLVPEDSILVPLAAAAGVHGVVWIYDAARGALRRFDASGRFRFGMVLDPAPKSVSISDLAVDRAGTLYAADAAGQRILVIGADGSIVLTRVLGGDRVPWHPAALAIGPRGQIAVADPERAEIQVLAPQRGARP